MFVSNMSHDIIKIAAHLLLLTIIPVPTALEIIVVDFMRHSMDITKVVHNVELFLWDMTQTGTTFVILPSAFYKFGDGRDVWHVLPVGKQNT